MCGPPTALSLNPNSPAVWLKAPGTPLGAKLPPLAEVPLAPKGRASARVAPEGSVSE